MWNMSVAAAATPGRSSHDGIDTGVGVLDRAVAIIGAVEGGARTFTDLVEATGLARSTAHRLIKALEEHGFLMLAGGLGYRLGPRLLGLAATAMRELPLRDLAHPSIERLAQTTGESSQLYVREGDRRICVDAVESNEELRTIVEIGASLPLSAGSAGKVFLAWASEAEGIVSRAERLTPKTPGRNELRHQLELTRRRGWAHSAGERQRGVGSVSAPVFGSWGQVLAAVSVSGPESRIGRISARRYAPAVVRAAREIQDALGVSTSSR